MNIQMTAISKTIQNDFSDKCVLIQISLKLISELGLLR